MNHACESHWRSVLTRSALLHGLQPPGSSVHGTLQARILEWVAMPSSRGSSQPKDQTQASRYRMADNEVKLSFSIA